MSTVEDNNIANILCWKHCVETRNILSVCTKFDSFTGDGDLNLYCPICKKSELIKNNRNLPPDSHIITPFVNCVSFPHAIVIRPTDGDFLFTYDTDCDLHIGMTDSTGTAYDYDQYGLHVSRAGWKRCIAVPVMPLLPQHLQEELSSTWDTKLQCWSLEPQWTSVRYSEEENNCFNFVLGFLQSLSLGNIIPSVGDKVHFCSQYLLPEVTRAVKYINLYRQLAANGPISVSVNSKVL